MREVFEFIQKRADTHQFRMALVDKTLRHYPSHVRDDGDLSELRSYTSVTQFAFAMKDVEFSSSVLTAMLNSSGMLPARLSVLLTGDTHPYQELRCVSAKMVTEYLRRLAVAAIGLEIRNQYLAVFSVNTNDAISITKDFIKEVIEQLVDPIQKPDIDVTTPIAVSFDTMPNDLTPFAHVTGSLRLSAPDRARQAKCFESNPKIRNAIQGFSTPETDWMSYHIKSL